MRVVGQRRGSANRSLAGIAGLNPSGGMDVSLVTVVCCQEEVHEMADPSSRGVLPTGMSLCVI